MLFCIQRLSNNSSGCGDVLAGLASCITTYLPCVQWCSFACYFCMFTCSAWVAASGSAALQERSCRYMLLRSCCRCAYLAGRSACAVLLRSNFVEGCQSAAGITTQGMGKVLRCFYYH
jgi:hypothetical protein